MDFSLSNGLPQSDGILRLGLVGMGKIGRIHYDHLRGMADVQIAGIAEPNGGIRDEPDIPWYDSWEDLLEDSGLDAVVIALPHFLHAECAGRALKRGLHVFLEKPLATSFSDATGLVAQAKAAGRILMVNMTHRFFPTLRRARQIIQEGVIGKLVTVHDHYMEVMDRARFPSWFFDPDLAGGGVTITDSIHLVDRVSWLIGEPLELRGQASRVVDPESRVEDCSELLCQSPSGIPVTVGSFFCFAAERTWADRLVLYGTKGTLLVHAWSYLELTIHGRTPERIECYPSALSQEERVAMGHHAAMEEFLSAMREKRIPEASGQSVLDAERVIGQFYRNAEIPDSLES